MINYISKVISILFLTCSFYINAQYGDGGQYVFVDGANIREQPSLKAKKIGLLKEGERIENYHSLATQYDTIGGRRGYWYPIQYKEGLGYIWEHTLTRFSFKSTRDLDQRFLVKQDLTGTLQFKIVRDNEPTLSVSFPTSDTLKLATVMTLGVLHNSKGKEVISVTYFNKNYGYDLYEWDGESLQVSVIKLDDDSHLTNKPIECNQYYISHENVNLRSDSTLESSIVATMSKYSKVNFIQQCRYGVRLGETYGHWVEIEYRGKRGFVWGHYLSKPFRMIKSNYEKGITFQYSSNAIYVLRDNKIIASTIFPNHHWEQEPFSQVGTMGLKAGLQFLSIYQSGESCGKYSGQHFYLWNGKTINYFGSSGGAGDGGEAEMSELYFPIEPIGVQDKVILDSRTEHWHDFGISYFRKEIKVLKYQNDTLVEIPSIHQKLRRLIKIKYPKYELMDYEFFDINQDGYQDVLYYISYSYYSEKVGDISDGIVGIALGNKSGELSVFRENKTLLNEEEGYPTVMLQVNKDSFSISKIYNSYYDSDYTPVCYRFNFSFKKSTNEIVWDSKSIIHMEGDYGQRVPKTKTSYFKKNKILFQDAWDNNSSDE